MIDLLTVRPHPDDESSATGGLLAKYAARGLRTAVVCCTGGEEGEIRDPDLDHEEAFPRLREIREGELRAACAVLGVGEIRLLGYRDSGMADRPSNEHPEAFCRVDLDEAGRRLARVLRELRPRVVVTEREGGLYGHPDHVMCYPVSARGLELAADAGALPDAGPPWAPERVYVMVPVFDGWEEIERLMKAERLDTSFIEKRRAMTNGALRPDEATTAVDVSDFAEIQRQALLCHRTQISPRHRFMQLPPHIRRHAYATAYLVRLTPPPLDGQQERELF